LERGTKRKAEKGLIFEEKWVLGEASAAIFVLRIMID